MGYVKLKNVHYLIHYSRCNLFNVFRLKLNGTHQVLAYADVVNLLGDNIDTINKNTQTLIGAGKEVSLEVNVEKTEYMLVSRDQNAGQNRGGNRKQII
jgi:hypothetical protein